MTAPWRRVFPGTWQSGDATFYETPPGMLVSEAMLGPAAAPPVEPVLRQSYGNASKVQTISVVAGDLIFVAFSAGGSLISASISDTVNTYSEITGAGFACTPSSIHAHCWSAVATTTGSLTLTITSAASYPVIIVHVYSGCDGTLDGASYKAEASASTSHTTNSLTTTAANDLLVAFWFQDNSSSATVTENGAGFTKRQEILNADGARQSSLDRIASAVGTYNDAVTTSSCIYGSLIVAFKADAGTATANATVAFTEAADIASLQAKADAGAVLAATEAQDTAALTLLEVVATSLAFTEAADTTSLQATVTAGLTPLDAALAYTEAQDVAALLAAAVVNGTLTASEAVDTFSLLAGAVAGATLGAIEGADTASLQATALVGAVLAFTEGPDTASLQAATPAALALVADENPDTCLLYAGGDAPIAAKISIVGMLVNVGTLLNRS